MRNIPVLVLDHSYLPVNIINTKKALTLVLSDKATIIEENNKEKVRSQYLNICPPKVIRLKGFSGYKQFSRVKIRFNKSTLLQRDNNRCQYCFKELTSGSATIDHVVPRSKGGKHVWENCVVSCKPCNIKKGDLYLNQTDMALLSYPKEPSYTTLVNRILSQHNKDKSWDTYLIN